MDGEVVFLRIFDIGRQIDLKQVQGAFPGIREKNRLRSKDTPSYVYFPAPFVLDLLVMEVEKVSALKNVVVEAKLYQDGLISIVARVGFSGIPVTALHTIKRQPIHSPDGNLPVRELIQNLYTQLVDKIRPFVSEYTFPVKKTMSEDYTVFCIWDTKAGEDPAAFVETHKEYLAPLLMGEKPNSSLHPDQIKDTFRSPFSFTKHDLVVFDFDRSLIIDPMRDYEEILVIVEQANIQYLELRVLDQILDNFMDVAEEDIRTAFFKRRFPWVRMMRRTGRLLRFQYDFVFISEYLENATKIIGDFYLAQMFTHLANLFRSNEWSASIRNRLTALESLYATAKTDITNRLLLYLEILLAVVFVTEFFLILFGQD